MSKLIKYLVAFILGIIIGNIIVLNSNTTSFSKQDEIKKEIEQDSIMRDSIYIVNDSIITKIIYLEKEYNEKINNIMSNNDSTNLVLFSRYIENYKRSIENN